MNNQDESIKKENRKALKVYIPFLIVSAIVGGVIGFFSATNGIQNFGEACSRTLSQLLYLLSPYGVILTELATVSAGICYYLTAKKELGNAEKEAEEEMEEEMEEPRQEEDDLIPILSMTNAFD